MISRVLGLPILAALIFFSCQEKSGTIAAIDSVDYNLHIRPILSDRCFKCHGPDANARKADLRLDTYEGAMAALKDNPAAHAIVAGKPESSEVYLRISTADTSEIMPPVKSNLKLSEYEIELIKKMDFSGSKIQTSLGIYSSKTASSSSGGTGRLGEQ